MPRVTDLITDPQTLEIVDRLFEALPDFDAREPGGVETMERIGAALAMMIDRAPRAVRTTLAQVTVALMVIPEPIKGEKPKLPEIEPTRH